MRQIDGEAIRCQDARHICGISVGQETRVKSYHHTVGIHIARDGDAIIPIFRTQRIGNRLRDKAQVGEGESVRNDGAVRIKSLGDLEFFLKDSLSQNPAILADCIIDFMLKWEYA